MNAAISLLNDLTSKGVEVVLDGDRVKLKGNHGNREMLTPENIETLRSSRGEVVTFLKTREKFPHGRAVNGYPKTWTGKIVSPDMWHELTEWERHGPDGRLWCGACREWVAECAHTVR